ncbi:MCE family protein [Streptomyces sp. wa1063]|uniref:MCE family protein n=1 Tax=Streptomyces sp. wa1063 TaxID=1828212 RepID=UPI000BEF3D42|nr:MCE family protein [Streptomyces sp. wa1063]
MNDEDRRRPVVRAAVGAVALLATGALIALVVVRPDGPTFTGIEQIPLPGGADLGDRPYEVTAEFGDVLSLAPQSSVKVNDVAVGRVTKIALAPDGWRARVTMRVNGKIKLPANAYARLEQSSLLGEKFIQLAPPPEGTARGSLAAGGRIPHSRTNRNPEVEEVFGALSLLLNGGGVNQLKTITTELNKALAGQEPQIRSMLNRVDTLVTNLDENKSDITKALDGVNRLAATLATRKQDVGTVLTGLSPGLKVLEKQRGSLLTMLRSLDTLSTVAVDTINRSKADMIADLKALAPTLKALADSGQDLPDSLQVLLTYPFTDEVLRGVKGDYLNVYLDVAAVPGTQIIPALTPDPPGIPLPPAEGEGAAARGALPLPLPVVSGTPKTGAPKSDAPGASKPGASKPGASGASNPAKGATP